VRRSRWERRPNSAPGPRAPKTIKKNNQGPGPPPRPGRGARAPWPGCGCGPGPTSPLGLNYYKSYR
jgi:hypothetical protein